MSRCRVINEPTAFGAAEATGNKITFYDECLAACSSPFRK
jgi:hypothetical protein